MAFRQMPEPGDPIKLGEFMLGDHRFPAVYFLYRRGEVVYVGQSKTLKFRIEQHLTEGVKMFDAVAFARCSVNLLTKVEGHYIRELAPKYNACAIARKTRERASWHPPDRIMDGSDLRWTVLPGVNGEIGDGKFINAADTFLHPDDLGEFIGVSDKDVAEWIESGELEEDSSPVDLLLFMARNHRAVGKAQQRFDEL